MTHRAIERISAAHLGFGVIAARACQSQGIQQLRHSEKQAAEKGSEARKRKNRRLKQAKAEAQAATGQHRLRREKELKAREAVALGWRGRYSMEVGEVTQEKMTVLQTYFQQNRDEVRYNRLAFVCDIRPKIHENYGINGWGRRKTRLFHGLAFRRLRGI